MLGLLFGYPERSFYANEVVRLAGVGTGSVQRELARLFAAGLVTVTKVGNQKHFQANPDCPFFPEIRSLVLKTFGTLDQLRGTLRALDGEIELAFLFGSDLESAVSQHLQLLVVSGDLKRAVVEKELNAVGQRIGRSIGLVLLSPARFQRLHETGDKQLSEVLGQSRIMLAGTLGADQSAT